MFDFISVDMNNKSSKLYKWINLINNIISYIQGKHQLLLHFLTKNDDIPKFYFTSQLYQNMIMLCITTCCNPQKLEKQYSVFTSSSCFTYIFQITTEIKN